MRLARINGTEGPYFSIQGTDDSWVAISSLGVMAETTPQLVAVGGQLAALDVGGIEGGVTDPEFLAPIVAPSKMLAAALNYVDHIEEQALDSPENPIFFAKYPSSLNGP